MAGLGEKFSQHARGLGGAAPGSAAVVGAISASTTTPFLGEPTSATRPILSEIALSKIEPDPNQPRRDLGDLSELAASIRELGLIQPIIVSIVGHERYRILAGERRFTAAGKAGLLTVPAIVRSVDEHYRQELQLVENLHRKDLNPFEEAKSYQRLIAEFNLTHEQLGKRLGKTQGSITEILQILNLPEHIQKEALESEGAGTRISKSLLQEIVRRPLGDQLRLWEAAKRGELTVRKIRAEREASPQQAGKMQRQSAGRQLPYRYPIALVNNNASVTIQFSTVRPRLEDVVAALEEALEMEKARLGT